MPNSLASALVSASRGGCRMRQAKIVGTSSPVTVDLNGGVTSVNAVLDSYTPVAGDVVLLLVDERAIVVLGKLVNP